MSFKHRCVQDLAWVIQSPPVISGEFQQIHWLNQTDCQAEYLACLPALHQLDKNPEPLKQVLSIHKPYVLGKRFECFVQYWLHISPTFELLHQAHVLRQITHTMGEADFIIREIATGKVIHLEVTVKFYLGTGDLSAMHHWYGTNLKDRLDIKFNRLRHHQTRLAEYYPELMPCPIDESWCLFKGRMFLPENQPVLPDFFAKDCPQGKWRYRHEISDAPSFLALQKQDWLAEVTTCETQHQPKLHIIPNPVNHSACFALCTEEEPGTIREQERYFILPNDFFNTSYNE